MVERSMAETNNWSFPTPMQPDASEVDFDLARALTGVVRLASRIPEDAFTAQMLGTEREGNGVVIRNDGLIVTIGYLITEAEAIWITTHDGRVVPGHPLAYDFAIAAGQSPDDYAELLEDSGVKAQARAPMTPIVKLVFGIDYDKARLTEFAAALSFAQRQQIATGGFQGFIEQQAGGLKALVAAEREARRPEPKTDTKGEMARAKLRSASPISLAEVPAAEEFAVVITRRNADGTHEPVAIVDDEALVERAIRRAA